MFLYEFDSEEKYSYLDLLIYSMEIDNVNDKNEIDFIKMETKNLNMPYRESISKCFKLEDALGIFESIESQRLLLLKLLILFHIDGDFSEKEKELLEKVVEFFSFERDSLNKYLEVAVTYSELFFKSNDLILGE